MRKVEKSISVFIAGVLVAGTIGGCATNTPNPDKATNTPTPISSPTYPSNTRTPELTATQPATVTPEPTPSYHVEAAGGEYTAEQLALNDSQSARDQKARIQRWLDYWIKFDNKPFSLNKTEIHWKYIYDNINNPTEVLVLIEAGGEYGGKMFTVPIGADGFADFPPAISNVGEKMIGEGYGPLELSSGTEGLWLSVDNDTPVRRDGNNNIAQRLNMVTRQWEAEPGYFSEIDMAKLHNFPESYKDVVDNPDEFFNCPDPLSRPEDFKSWLEALLPLLDKEKNIDIMGIAGGTDVLMKDFYGEPVHGEPKFCFFMHDGKVYPVVILNAFRDEIFNKTLVLIIYPGDSPMNRTEAIEGISKGKAITGIGFVITAGGYPSEVGILIDNGLTGNILPGVLAGFSMINTAP